MPGFGDGGLRRVMLLPEDEGGGGQSSHSPWVRQQLQPVLRQGPETRRGSVTWADPPQQDEKDAEEEQEAQRTEEEAHLIDEISSGSSEESSVTEEGEDDDDQHTIAIKILGEMETLQKKFHDNYESLDWTSIETLKGKWTDIFGEDMAVPVAPSSRCTVVTGASAKCFPRLPTRTETKMWLQHRTVSQMSRILGPDFHRLIGVMCVRITNRHMLHGREVQHLLTMRTSDGPFAESDWNDVESWTRGKWKQLDGPARPLEDVAPRYNKDTHLDPICSRRRNNIIVDIYWCGLSLRPDSFLQFLFALHESRDAKVFQTPLVAAMVDVCWKRAKRQYYGRRAVDCLMLCQLIWIGLHSRLNAFHPCGEEERMPNKFMIIVFFCLSVMNLIVLVFEMWSCKKVFGYLLPVMQLFSIVNQFMEGIIFVVAASLMNDAVRPERFFFICNHPLILASLICVKSLQLEVQMMTLDCFQDSVVPAWEALTSRASATFLAFIAFAMCGVWFALVSLPRLNWQFNEPPGLGMFSNGRNGLTTDLKDALYIMQRMALMGDFDADVIEGKNKSISFTYNTSASSFQTKRLPTTETSMTNDLPIFCLCVTLIFVVLMNVYIGILSNEYNRAVSDLRRLTGRHRIIVSIPHLLFLSGLSHLGLAGRGEGLGVLQGNSLLSGFWFALPAENQKHRRIARLKERMGADTWS